VLRRNHNHKSVSQTIPDKNKTLKQREEFVENVSEKEGKRNRKAQAPLRRERKQVEPKSQTHKKKKSPVPSPIKPEGRMNGRTPTEWDEMVYEYKQMKVLRKEKGYRFLLLTVPAPVHPNLPFASLADLRPLVGENIFPFSPSPSFSFLTESTPTPTFAFSSRSSG